MAAIVYQDTLDGIKAEMLDNFFNGWRTPRTPKEHLQIITNSSEIVLALDTQTGKVVGHVNALSDGLQSAFIPLLEVIPSYQNRGIGSELMRKMLDKLSAVYGVDLMCDPELQPFYERFGLQRSVGMVKRNF